MEMFVLTLQTAATRTTVAPTVPACASQTSATQWRVQHTITAVHAATIRILTALLLARVLQSTRLAQL
jgi:hypothetical protein